MSVSGDIIAASPLKASASGLAVSEQNPGRWPIRYQAIESLVILVDLVAIFIVCLLAELVVRLDGAAIDPFKAAGSTVLVSSIFVCVLKIRGLYRPSELLGYRNQIRAIGLAWSAVVTLLAFAVVALGISHEVPRGAAVWIVTGPVTLIALRFAIRRLLRTGLNKRKFAARNVVLVTDRLASQAKGLEDALAVRGSLVTRTFSLPPVGAEIGSRRRLSRTVVSFVSGSDVEEIVIEAEPTRWPELRSFVRDLRVLPLPVMFVPVGSGSEFFKRPTREVGDVLGVEMERGPLSSAEQAAKRALDVICAGFALLLLFPVLAIAAAAIKLDSPGPILFKQRRCGFNGRTFTIRKFRTMRVLEDGPVVEQAGRCDRRVTRVGKWLRRFSIDELPQLFDVLGGAMSIVGPRPHALAHEDQFAKSVRSYAFRRRVKPGLTGWAQIHGCRGATPTDDMVERRVEYDLWYISNWSLALDLAIVAQTPLEVLRARNAY